MLKVVVIDGQGGGFGRQLVAGIKERLPQVFVTAVGANSAATAAMLKAGADVGATGENAAIVACRNADVITGPIGIVIADALFGEITAAMAAAAAQSPAKRVLLPFNHCDNLIVGVEDFNPTRLVRCAVDRIAELAETPPESR